MLKDYHYSKMLDSRKGLSSGPKGISVSIPNPETPINYPYTLFLPLYIILPLEVILPLYSTPLYDSDIA